MDLKLVKLHDIEEKINRIEALLNDKLGQIHRCTDTTMENTDKLRNELANMKEQINSNPYKL